MPHSDIIDYHIYGDDMQFVEVELDPGESAVAEAGAMLTMDDDIDMTTVMGDGSDSASVTGLASKLVGAGKRLLTGEGLFMTLFTNAGHSKRKVSFSAPFPGTIVPLDLRAEGGTMMCQKDAFLCAAKGVSIGIAFQKRILTGIFGGEGFVMQTLEGDGLAFVHAGGTLQQRKLGMGETIRVDTGAVVAYTPTVQFDVQMVGGVKNMLFGGEGLYLGRLTGPGTVWIQSLPFSTLAAQIVSRAGITTSRRDSRRRPTGE